MPPSRHVCFFVSCEIFARQSKLRGNEVGHFHRDGFRFFEQPPRIAKCTELESKAELVPRQTLFPDVLDVVIGQSVVP